MPAASSITLKAARRAQGGGGRDHRAAQARRRRHPGHDGLFPAGAGHPDFARASSRAQYQYTLVGTDAAEVALVVGPAGRRAAARIATVRDVSSEAQEGGLRALVKVDREKAGRLGISMQVVNDTLNDAFGQRQISTIYGQANQYRVILEAAPQYQRDPSALSKIYVPANIPSQPLSTSSAQNAQQLSTFVPGSVEHAGAAQRLRRADPHHRAARDRAPGAVPLGDAELQPRARRGARRRGRDHRVGRARDRHAAVGDRQLFGRHRGVRQVARRRAVADPRRRGDDLHRARRAVRELHPSADHPVHAAVGRRRRAARPDAGRAGPVGHRADRHRAADGHREEERHHDDRLRARGRAPSAACRRATRSCRPRCCASARS